MECVARVVTKLYTKYEGEIPWPVFRNTVHSRSLSHHTRLFSKATQVFKQALKGFSIK